MLVTRRGQGRAARTTLLAVEAARPGGLVNVMPDEASAVNSQGATTDPAPLDVEVSVVNHEGRDMLRDCLKGLPEATGRLRWHATVVDNASRDGSIEMLGQEFPWARVIPNSTPRGFASNHNQVIRPVVAESTARYVLVLNNDTELAPASIQHLVDFADGVPSLGATSPVLLNSDGSTQPTHHVFPSLPRHIRSELLPRPPAELPPGAMGWLSGACLLLRIAALRQVGTFDTRFFLFYEDVDLAARLLEAGWISRLCPTVTIVHHDHGTVGRSELRLPMGRQMLRSRYLYFQKHHGTPTACLAALATDVSLGLRAAKAVARSLAGRAPDRPAASFLLGLARFDPARPLPHERLSAGLHATMASTRVPPSLVPPR